MQWKTLTAIGAITILEAIALFNGINGTQFALTVGLIAALGGYHAKDTIDELLGKKNKK